MEGLTTLDAAQELDVGLELLEPLHALREREAPRARVVDEELEVSAVAENAEHGHPQAGGRIAVIARYSISQKYFTRYSQDGTLTVCFCENLGDLIHPRFPAEKIPLYLDEQDDSGAERDELVLDAPSVCHLALQQLFRAVNDFAPEEVYYPIEDLARDTSATIHSCQTGGRTAAM